MEGEDGEDKVCESGRREDDWDVPASDGRDGIAAGRDDVNEASGECEG